jgi:hypothetical protein
MTYLCVCEHDQEEHTAGGGPCMIIGCHCPQFVQESSDLREDLEITCRACGCTESYPCAVDVGGSIEPCSWVEHDPETGLGLCSACAD